MKYTFAAFALLAMAAQADAATSWADLWRNADQRGEALLQQGDAAHAAREYTDPRRRGYAEFKAGNYAAAAKELAGFDDSDTNYNRGNALAHAGDLHGAISAYDAALKRDPHNQDARHNRELVMNALKQKSSQQQGDGDKSKNGKQDGKNGSGKDSSSSGQGKPSEQSKQAGSGKNGQQNGQQSAKQSTPGNAPDQQGQRGDPGEAKQDTQAKHDTQNTQKAHGEDNNDADQARRDAASSLAGTAPGTPGTSGTQKNVPAGADAKSPGAQHAAMPESEKQLAQEQWLRSIPDDPGGLLRRKFLIEHMMRQHNNQP